MGLLGKIFNFTMDAQYSTKQGIDMRIAELMDKKRRTSDPNVKNDLQKRIDDLRVKKRYAKQIHFVQIKKCIPLSLQAAEFDRSAAY